MRNKLFPSTRNTAWLAVVCILSGMLLAGPTAQAAEEFLKAVPSWQKIYLDGQEVQMTAYNIGGNNYVKLRDIGKAVGFNVYWDTAANSVQIDSDAPYTGEAPAFASTNPAADAILVGSVKGNTLKAGERSRLTMNPAGAVYSVTSSNPEMVSIENVSGFWVAVAKAPGAAVVTVTDEAGNKGTLELTVEADDPKPPVDLTANMDIRQEMVRLINEVRVQNGVAELSINNALMDAAQDCSAQRFTSHQQEYECKAGLAYGYPHGFGSNLTSFAALRENVAQEAVKNWVESRGHFQTMISDSYHCVGVGVTIQNGRSYCYMFVGDPNSYNPYG